MQVETARVPPRALGVLAAILLVVAASLAAPPPARSQADGSQTEVFAGGMLASRLAVAFTPPVDASEFTLFWPDNPGVELPE